MKNNLKTLAIAILIPVLTGSVAGLLTRSGMQNSNMVKPPLSPPSWLFPIVWTILYILMGVASYLIYTSGKDSAKIKDALRIYIAQLAINFIWSFIFFNLNWYFLSFVLILVLWYLIYVTILLFLPIKKEAAYLLIPYLLWVTFAAYLTFGVMLLN